MENCEGDSNIFYSVRRHFYAYHEAHGCALCPALPIGMDHHNFSLISRNYSPFLFDSFG